MVANKTKARLVLLATFTLGILAGVLGMNLLNTRTLGSRSATGQLEELTTEVKLTGEQRQQVEQILAETKQQYRELQNQVHPKFVEIRTATRTRIRALLTPEQQALYDEWNRKRDARFNRKSRDGGARKAREGGPPTDKP
jgi:Spy/CpxP family protein refolding chaperone